MLRGARVSLAAASRLSRAAASAPASSSLSGTHTLRTARISPFSFASRTALPAFSLRSSKTLFSTTSAAPSASSPAGAAASDPKTAASPSDAADAAKADVAGASAGSPSVVNSDGSPASATDSATAPTDPSKPSEAVEDDDDDEWEWVTDDEGVVVPPPPPANEEHLNGAVPSLLETFVVKPHKYKRTSPGIFLDHIPSPVGPEDPLFSVATHRNRTFAITLSGRVFVKGLGIVGQLGLGGLKPYVSEFTEIHDLPPIKSIFPGKSHTLFLASDGSLHVSGCCSALDWLRPSARLPRSIPTFGEGTRAGRVVDATGNKYWAQVLTEKGRVYAWQTSPILSLVRGGTTQKPKKIEWGVRSDTKEEGEEGEEEVEEVEEEEEEDEKDKKGKGKGDDKSKGKDKGKKDAKDGKKDASSSKPGATKPASETGKPDASAKTGPAAADVEAEDEAEAAEKEDIPEEETEDYKNDGTGPRASKLMLGGSKVHHGFLTEKGRLYLWGLNGSGQLGRTHRTSSKGQKEQVWQAFTPIRCAATELSPVYAASAFNSATLAVGEDNNLVKFGVGRSAPIANQYLRGMPTPLRDLTVGEDNTVIVDKEGGLYSFASYELEEPIGYPGFGEDSSTRYGRIVHVSKGRHPVLLVECNPAYQKYINAARDKERRLRTEAKESGVRARYLERAYAPNQEIVDKNKAKEQRPEEED